MYKSTISVQKGDCVLAIRSGHYLPDVDGMPRNATRSNLFLIGTYINIFAHLNGGDIVLAIQSGRTSHVLSVQILRDASQRYSVQPQN